jgi:hypothetical protein
VTLDDRLRLLADIGADRYSSLAEIVATSHGDAWAQDAWRVYDEHFDRFTGALLDPEFERFRHPAAQTGTLELRKDTAVLVVGTGPSLNVHGHALQAVRERLVIFTSPRGAASLCAFGLTPDLVIIEHASSVDADLSLEFAVHAALPANTWIAAERRTPAALLHGVDPQRLFIPDEWPGWGCWPATAVALALRSGCGRVGLLGVDLGTQDIPDPRLAPTAALLGLLAATGEADCLDVGGGAPKHEWRAGTLETLCGHGSPRFHVDLRPIDADASVAEAAQWRSQSDAVITCARQALVMAEAARDSGAPESALRAAGLMMSWRSNDDFAVGVERVLGASFLPRLWREGLNAGSERPWRPVILALYELLAQADRLDAALGVGSPGVSHGR